MQAEMAVRVTDVVKRHPAGAGFVEALRGVSLEVAQGEFVSLMGASGSGKSTLLHLIAGLDVPSSGQVEVAGRDLAAASDVERTDLRRTEVGVIFQLFNLLPSVTALENVALPLRAAAVGRREMLERAHHALTRVGLAERAEHYPDALSGGEMQRVAIARALVIRPRLLLADEPTGSLDSRTGEDVLTLIRNCNREDGVSVLLVTHSAAAAVHADRVVTMRDGRIVDSIDRAALLAGMRSEKAVGLAWLTGADQADERLEARLAGRSPVDLGHSAADTLREERAARDSRPLR